MNVTVGLAVGMTAGMASGAASEVACDATGNMASDVTTGAPPGLGNNGAQRREAQGPLGR
ncbi:hypothetical protein FCH28_19430 [Streptomyces piniterrae]|uniref:Uncharacterized protein n=1 Tax=Streptomyces piniterrae TaxID=2571125 RepID=A0A4U0NDH3_9ACTN|nr:hypothetical protein [Streptomyces piniterrae]TJZ52020.1 hypothetical protein FCH28_19430 [Streptomyces piniterrae]